MHSDDKLAFYVPSLIIGGAERVTVNLANEFVERGVDVDLIVSYRTGDLVDHVNDAVSIIDLETPRVPIVGIAAGIPALVRYLRKEAPNVFFSQMHYANIVSIAAHTAAATDTKLVLTEHNMFGSVRQPKDRLVFVLARRSYRYADHVLAVSEGVAESLRDEVAIPERKLSVIYNPVVTPTLRESAEASVEHPWLNSDDTDVVLSAGGMIEQKDFSTLLEAVAIALESRSTLRLIILGEGPLRDALIRTAEELDIGDRVSLPGYVDNQYSYMQNADVFALSSRWEGLPTVLIEAMACGTPVVSTDCRSGPREILAGGEYGPLVPVGDAYSLAEGIEDVLREPVPSSVLQDRADDFTVEAIIDEYEQLVDHLV